MLLKDANGQLDLSFGNGGLPGAINPGLGIAEGGANVSGATLEVSHSTLHGQQSHRCNTVTRRRLRERSRFNPGARSQHVRAPRQPHSSAPAATTQGNALSGALVNLSDCQATVLHSIFEGNVARGAKGPKANPARTAVTRHGRGRRRHQ